MHIILQYTWGHLPAIFNVIFPIGISECVPSIHFTINPFNISTDAGVANILSMVIWQKDEFWLDALKKMPHVAILSQGWNSGIEIISVESSQRPVENSHCVNELFPSTLHLQIYGLPWQSGFEKLQSKRLANPIHVHCMLSRIPLIMHIYTITCSLKFRHMIFILLF